MILKKTLKELFHSVPNQAVTNSFLTNKMINARALAILLLIALSCVFLLLRVSYLEVLQFSKYHKLSYKNQVTIKPVTPIRGLIYDRNGGLLAQNIPLYHLEIVPEQVKDLDETLSELQTLLPSLNLKEIIRFKKTLNQYHKFEPVPLLSKLTEADAATFAVNKYFFRGVSLKPALMRTYPKGELYAHLLGYVGRINQQEWQSIDRKNYHGTNYIGKLGIEKYYEETLHGKIGLIEAETDAAGRVKRTFNSIKAQSGSSLTLTIDSELQQAAHDALNDLEGAIVAIDPKNGEVLAMVSYPSYQPNSFVNGLSNEDYEKLISSPREPLFNRAIRGQYPLASTIKPFVSVAALSDKIISENYAIYDPGWFRLPNSNHLYRDWKRNGHGWVGVERAIVVSCDTYFYKLAELMGINKINDVLTQFGFGQKTHIDLLEELPGLIPTPLWKKNTKNKSWYTGDTLISGIGQGFMLTTPLQLAKATAAFANKGKHYRPHLVKKIYNPNNNKTELVKPIEEYPINYKQQSWQVIFKALSEVISSREGTGFRYGRNTPYTVAAKTGTAQIISLRNASKKNELMPKHLRDHSLFIGFAPVEDPKIAIAVVVENANPASSVARKVIDNYLLRSKKNA